MQCPVPARRVQRVYRPGRNGRLSVSVANAAKLLNVSGNTARKAFRQLEERGFLALTEEAQYADGLVREYQLTIEPVHGREPTDEWRNWQPESPILLLGRPKRKNDSHPQNLRGSPPKGVGVPVQDLRGVGDAAVRVLANLRKEQAH